MSEPMTNMEIEDVLSSIRRLVSEDFRAPGPERVRSPDKLVLTPAFRVVADNPEPLVEAPLEDTITREAAAAVLESALSGTAGDWEPDGSEIGATDWSVEWERERDRMVRLHLRPTAEQAVPVEALVEPVEPVSVAEDMAEPVFSEEDDLRDMVREIIREELQGDLGERITRSVRKLVRAEIARALAARDLG